MPKIKTIWVGECEICGEEFQGGTEEEARTLAAQCEVQAINGDIAWKYVIGDRLHMDGMASPLVVEKMFVECRTHTSVYVLRSSTGLISYCASFVDRESVQLS